VCPPRDRAALGDSINTREVTALGSTPQAHCTCPALEFARCGEGLLVLWEGTSPSAAMCRRAYNLYPDVRLWSGAGGVVQSRGKLRPNASGADRRIRLAAAAPRRLCLLLRVQRRSVSAVSAQAVPTASLAAVHRSAVAVAFSDPPPPLSWGAHARSPLLLSPFLSPSLTLSRSPSHTLSLSLSRSRSPLSLCLRAAARFLFPTSLRPLTSVPRIQSLTFSSRPRHSPLPFPFTSPRR
jgi:hypothetical protein